MAERQLSAPSLDLLRGFAAAARHLNFTRAAEELFLTQSAVSRQIQILEAQLGVALFVRQARGIGLTEAGERLNRAVTAAMEQLHTVIDEISGAKAAPAVTLSCTLAFCSLWLIPRLAGFQTAFPGVDVRLAANNNLVNMERERVDLAIRYCATDAIPANAIPLFDETILPVCSPTLLKDSSRPLKTPSDLSRHVLLHLDDAHGRIPWLAWPDWLKTAGVPALRAAGSLHFNHYDQVVRAAISGQGVGLGRLPLIDTLLGDGTLLAPLGDGALSHRTYCLIASPLTGSRAEVASFVAWLIQEGRQAAEIAVAKPRRTRAKAAVAIANKAVSGAARANRRR